MENKLEEICQASSSYCWALIKLNGWWWNLRNKNWGF